MVQEDTWKEGVIDEDVVYNSKFRMSRGLILTNITLTFLISILVSSLLGFKILARGLVFLIT